jgi:hypothetical protein
VIVTVGRENDWERCTSRSAARPRRALHFSIGVYTLPTVTTGQNGPGTATSYMVVNDAYGRPVWTKDAGGFINYTT